MAAAHALLWRRHRWTALRSLLLVALLHRLHCLAFLAASSPVWLLAAFLLGVVLVHSEPNVPLAAASEDEDRHLTATGGISSGDNDSSDDGSSATSMEDVGEKEEEVVKAAVAWTADDERSIQSIGSLELERDARLEKLMSRRSIHRNLIDLDIHIPAVLTKNPFDLHHHHHDDPGSAPSALLGQHSNPFDFDVHQRDPEMLRRHESFTAGAAPPARPSRFRPYFVADVPAGGGGDAGSDNSNSSSSPSSSAASDQKAHQQAAVKVEEEEEEEKAAAAAAAASPSPPKWGGNGMVVAVDVELISDSSDDDMSLPGDDAAGSLNNPRDEDEDSFEVESITQQVAAANAMNSTLPSISLQSPCFKLQLAPQLRLRPPRQQPIHTKKQGFPLKPIHAALGPDRNGRLNNPNRRGATLPSSPLSDVVQEFYSSLNEKNSKRLDKLIAPDCVIEDTAYYKPLDVKCTHIYFKRLMESMGENVKFATDEVCQGAEHTAAVMWHPEWNGYTIPFTKGCSFYICSENGAMLLIRKVHIFDELPLKPGKWALEILNIVTNLLNMFPKIAEGFLKDPEAVVQPFVSSTSSMWSLLSSHF
ncbi:uncharacterized protein C2845_PM02G40620 [Panicum miliaceum]|uniref:SnoaL-like domain-containing protein n=1 Tax=Panicum miliaceum TaxID=4540 RepID=A0A3L6S930_PANMI|nr:uncharacterized protein C2845_PM02G40620 [Panicum miliaceum]